MTGGLTLRLRLEPGSVAPNHAQWFRWPKTRILQQIREGFQERLLLWRREPAWVHNAYHGLPLDSVACCHPQGIDQLLTSRRPELFFQLSAT